MLFVYFTKAPGGFPYVLIITGKVHILIPINGITLGDQCIFVLGGDQEVFDGAATYEVSLDTIPTTDLFDTFTKTLCLGYDYVALILNFSCGSRGTSGTLVVNPINGLTGRPVKPFLHLVQSPLGIFALSESFPKVFLFLSEQLRITAHSFSPMFITLNLAERLWWLSHCRYWSLWVSFLYTVMDRPPFSSCLTIVSKKGMESSSLLSSTVNLWHIQHCYCVGGSLVY